jgi:hypothetical protein
VKVTKFSTFALKQ